MTNEGRLGVTRRVERFLIGAVMSVMAWALERVVSRASRREKKAA